MRVNIDLTAPLAYSLNGVIAIAFDWLQFIGILRICAGIWL